MDSEHEHMVAERSILHEQARRLARDLRREAIGDFWRGADAAWAASMGAAQRSAYRLAQRLARHARQRMRETPAVKEG